MLFKIKITYNILYLPLSILLIFFFSCGLSLLFSCVNVYYRETDYVVRYMLRILFFLTPIFYSVEKHIPKQYLDAYLILNPLAVILMSFRSAFMGLAPPDVKYILITFLYGLGFFFVGYWFLNKNENEVVKRI